MCGVIGLLATSSEVRVKILGDMGPRDAKSRGLTD